MSLCCGFLRTWTLHLRYLLIIACLSSIAFAQVTTPENPAYVDDSTAARDVLDRIDDLQQQGSMAEAIRSIQSLLDEEGTRVLAVRGSPDLFRSVRSAVHERLLRDEDLLDAYRTSTEPDAKKRMEQGAFVEVAQSRFLTPSGFESALRVAQMQLERAAFHASLMTLAELEQHPSFASRKSEAAALLRLLAPYLDDTPADLLDRWQVPQDLAPVDRPPGLDPVVVDATHTGRATRLDGFIPRPLTSADLSPFEEEVLSEDEIRFNSRRSVPNRSPFGWTLPTVVGDVVYTNDTDHITAWDRFTLRELWQVRRMDQTEDNLFSQRDIRRRQSRRIEDSSEITVVNDRLLAVTGLAVGGTRQGDARLHCLNRQTGEVLWSVSPSSLDSPLEGASIRGPAVVSEGTVVVALRKWARERRTVSVYLVGLDLEDGSWRWSRLIGSAGALPFQTAGRFPERVTVDRGVVYRCDEMGIVAAIEADSGRPRWVHRFESFALYDNDVRPPWTSSGPLVRQNDLITIEPSRERLVMLDRTTGEIIDSLPASRFASPDYLIRAGDKLVGVGSQQIAWIDLDAFPNGRVGVSDQMSSPPIVGRVAVAGDELIVPRDGLMTSIHIETRAMHTREIDQPGNLIALDGQILATDNARLHSYMVWDVASQLLQERLDADPDNPAPAATLAELAYRAQRFDQIVEPVDRALAAIRRDPDAHESTRRSLFVSVLSMVDPSTAPQAELGAEPSADPVVNDVRLLTTLTDRLEALAESPEEMVSHRLVQATLRESVRDVRGAIESLQGILRDAYMAESFWRGGQLTIRADLEATRRIRRLLGQHGWGAYADFERESQAQYALVDATARAEDWQRLARIYPFSTLTPAFWLAASERADPQSASRVLQNGVRSLESLHALGAPIDPEVASELFGRAAQSLVADKRIGEAHALVQSHLRTFPDLVPTVSGTVLALDDLLGSFNTQTSTHRRARLGLSVATNDRPTLEQGRVLVAAMNGARPAPSHKALLASPSGRLIRLLAFDREGNLGEQWVRDAPFEPILLEMTDDEALVAWLDPQGMRFESIDLADGETRWTAQPLIPADVRNGVNRGSFLTGFVTPLEGRVLSDQLLVAGDDRLLAITERTGRIVTLDRTSGQVLWNGQTNIQRVFDIALGSGMLIVGGTAPDAADNWKTALITLDARTGEVASRLDDAPGAVRWLRIGDSRHLIAGLDRGLVCLDLNESQVRWMLSEDPALSSVDAWVFDDQLLVLDQNRSLWRVDIPSGRLIRPEMESRGRLTDRTGIQAELVHGNMVFTSGSGMLIYDTHGELVGIDVFDTVGMLVPSEAGQSITAVVDSSPIQSPDGLSSYLLYLIANESGRLIASYPIRAHATPEVVRLLDGKILISAGEATLIVNANPEQ